MTKGDDTDNVRHRSDIQRRTANDDDRNGATASDDDRNGATAEVDVEAVSLKREVGLFSGVSLIVGTMIGSGIFISPKGVLQATGSVALSLLVWAGCGVIAVIGSLCYAELGTTITMSGAEYAYLNTGLGGVFAYMYAFTSSIVIRPSTVAVICLAFAEYVCDPIFDGCGPPQFIVKMLAAAVIVLLCIINCYSVRLATQVQVFFTVVKLAALAVIIVGGLVKLGQGNTETLSTGFEGTTSNPSVIALAFYDGLWAYDGWNNLNYVTEELKNPIKNLPRAIIIALPLVTIVYILTNISYLTVMTTAELLASTAVGVTWADRVLGAAAIIIPISVACSTFGAANGTLFTGGRLSYVAAREGHLPGILSYVHAHKYTPFISLVFTSIISILMIIPGNISSLIDFFSFSVWLFYGATFLALIVMRFRYKDWPRPIKLPIIIPIIALLISLYLVIAPIIDNPKIEFLYVAVFIASGLIFYVPFVMLKWRLKITEYVTLFLQLFTEVAPTKYNDYNVE